MNHKKQIILLCLILAGWTTSIKGQDQPNILLIYMDDMGYGDLECYGHPTIQTPNLNALAHGGVRFTQFYAPATVCTPSRAGLLTGRYPVRHTPHNFGPESEKGMPLDEQTIAQVLREVGYRTACIGKWHLGHQVPYLPTSRGFDHYFGLPYSNDMILPWCPWLSESDRLYMYQDTSIMQEIGKNQKNLMIDFTDKAIELIRADEEQPFFLYLAHSMPHLPISAPDQFRGTSLAGLYGDVIETIDWTIGELMRALREEDIEKETIVIFTSDNGPWHNLPDRMLQDGIQSWHTGTAGMLRGAKATTYEGGQRVPAIMYWPGVIPAGQVNRSVATGLDIFPTLASVAGADYNLQHIDGLNLLPAIKGEETFSRSTFYYSQGDRVQAVRQDNWKLRITPEDGIQLFDLHVDPSEQYNRQEEFPDHVKALTELLKEHAQETGAKFELN